MTRLSLNIQTHAQGKVLRLLASMTITYVFGRKLTLTNTAMEENPRSRGRIKK